MALSDIEIARQANKKPIKEVAKTLNLDEDSLHTFGNFTAKITSETTEKISENFFYALWLDTYPNGRDVFGQYLALIVILEKHCKKKTLLLSKKK